MGPSGTRRSVEKPWAHTGQRRLLHEQLMHTVQVQIPTDIPCNVTFASNTVFCKEKPPACEDREAPDNSINSVLVRAVYIDASRQPGGGQAYGQFAQAAAGQSWSTDEVHVHMCTFTVGYL